MRKIALVAAASAAALSLAACSEATEDSAGETVDSAAVNLYVLSKSANSLVIGATAPFTGEVDVMVIKIS